MRRIFVCRAGAPAPDPSSRQTGLRAVVNPLSSSHRADPARAPRPMPPGRSPGRSPRSILVHCRSGPWAYRSAGRAPEWHAGAAERSGQPLPDHDRTERNRPSYRLWRRDDNDVRADNCSLRSACFLPPGFRTRSDERAGDSQSVLDTCRDPLRAFHGEELGVGESRQDVRKPPLSVVANRSPIMNDASGMTQVIVSGGEAISLAWQHLERRAGRQSQ